MKRRLVAILSFLLILPVAALAAPTVDRVQKALICQCGCNMELDACECRKADNMRAEIASLIKRGKGRQQIVGTFVAQYGETVRSAPPRNGFGLAAWITPFLAIILGGWILYGAARKWALRRSRYSEPNENSDDPAASDYGPGLKDELDKFDEGELT